MRKWEMGNGFGLSEVSGTEGAEVKMGKMGNGKWVAIPSEVKMRKWEM